MNRPGRSSGIAPYALITAGLFAFTSCYLLPVDAEAGRRCRPGVVAAVDHRSPGPAAPYDGRTDAAPPAADPAPSCQ